MDDEDDVNDDGVVVVGDDVNDGNGHAHHGKKKMILS